MECLVKVAVLIKVAAAVAVSKTGGFKKPATATAIATHVV